jgi:hypothetical protein
MLEHQGGIAPGIHGAPDHPGPFFDQDHPLPGLPQLVSNRCSSGAAPNHNAIDRAILVLDALRLWIVVKTAGRDRWRMDLGIDIGILHEIPRAA